MEQEENEESGRVKFLSEQLDQMDQNWTELQASVLNLEAKWTLKKLI